MVIEARQLVAGGLSWNLDDNEVLALNHGLEIPVDRREIDAIHA